jgi:hypothetical protein
MKAQCFPLRKVFFAPAHNLILTSLQHYNPASLLLLCKIIGTGAPAQVLDCPFETDVTLLLEKIRVLASDFRNYSI